MTRTITADHPAFRAAVDDVRRAAELLRDERDRIAREVDGLLADGWRGGAASAFADGWAKWQHSADTVLDGLVAMGDLLEAVDTGLLRTDQGSAADLDRIAGRLDAGPGR